MHPVTNHQLLQSVNFDFDTLEDMDKQLPVKPSEPLTNSVKVASSPSIANPKSKDPAFDERFDAVKERMPKKAKYEPKIEYYPIPFSSTLSIENGLNGPYVHLETPVHSSKDEIDFFLMQYVNVELSQKGKPPILQIHVEDFNTGICSIVGTFSPSMIIKIDPGKLLAGTGQDALARAAKKIVTTMGYMNLAFKSDEGGPQQGYLKEFAQLWDKRFEKKFDLSKSEDIKILLFKNLLKNLDVKEIYEWNGITFLTADHCSKLQTVLFKERVFRLLEIFHFFVDGPKPTLEDLANQLKKERDRSAFSYETLWMASFLCVQISTFPQRFPELTRALHDIEEFDAYLAREGHVGMGNHAMQRAFIDEIVQKWKLFAHQPDQNPLVQMNKKLLFQILLKGCIDLWSCSKEAEMPLEKFLRTIDGLREIADHENYTAFAFKLDPVSLEKAVKNSKIRAEELLSKGAHNVFPHKGHFVFFIPKGSEGEMKLLAKSLLA